MLPKEEGRNLKSSTLVYFGPGDPCSPAYVHISQIFLENNSLSCNYSLSLYKVTCSPQSQTVLFPMSCCHLQLPFSPNSALQERYTNISFASFFLPKKSSHAHRSLEKLLVSHTQKHLNLYLISTLSVCLSVCLSLSLSLSLSHTHTHTHTHTACLTCQTQNFPNSF